MTRDEAIALANKHGPATWLHQPAAWVIDAILEAGSAVGEPVAWRLKHVTYPGSFRYVDASDLPPHAPRDSYEPLYAAPQPNPPESPDSPQKGE